MTNSISGQAAASRESDRHSDGQVGAQHRDEVEIGGMVPIDSHGEEQEVDPFAGWLTVDEEDREHVEKISTLRGANAGEESEQTWDDTDAETLLSYAPQLAQMLELAQVHGKPARLRKTLKGAEKRAAENHEIVRQRLDRFARELVGYTWEKRRRRLDGGPIRSGKYTNGAAWSPEALRVILEPDGSLRAGTPWKNALTLEHVVPAGTIARLLARMHKERKSPSEVAEALRGVVRHATVKKGGTDAGRRDEPSAQGMRSDMEEKLILHFLGKDEHRLDDEVLFQVTWSRYLDPKRRGADGREMDWRLGQLRTVTETLGIHESER